MKIFQANSQTKEIQRLKTEIKDLKTQLYKKVDTIDYLRNKLLLIERNLNGINKHFDNLLYYID